MATMAGKVVDSMYVFRCSGCKKICTKGAENSSWKIMTNVRGPRSYIQVVYPVGKKIDRNHLDPSNCYIEFLENDNNEMWFNCIYLIDQAEQEKNSAMKEHLKVCKKAARAAKKALRSPEAKRAGS